MTKKETTAVATRDKVMTPAQVAELDKLGSWGAEDTSAADLIIPKILIMQGQSDFVNDDKIQARQGEIRDSLEGKLLAKIGESIRFIPFFFYNTWVEFTEKEKKFVFSGMHVRDRTNEDLEWEWVDNGVNKKRAKAINCYVLLENELEDGVYLPYLLSFRNTSFKEGKKLVTLVEKLKQFKLSPAHRVFELSTTKVTNEKGTWFGPEVTQVAETSEGHLFQAYQWYLKVAKGGVKVDNSDLEKEAEAATQAPSTEF